MTLFSKVSDEEYLRLFNKAYRYLRSVTHYRSYLDPYDIAHATVEMYYTKLDRGSIPIIEYCAIDCLRNVQGKDPKYWPNFENINDIDFKLHDSQEMFIIDVLAIQQLLENIGNRARKILEYKIQGYQGLEIAKILGISHETVSNITRRELKTPLLTGKKIEKKKKSKKRLKYLNYFGAVNDFSR